MRVVVAIDSLKGSLSSLEAGQAVAEGIHRAEPEAEVEICPLADGGEGTVETLVQSLGGTFRTIPVTGPAGKPVFCRYGYYEKGQRTAVIEMSGAAGITLLSPEEKNPLSATTYGVGEVILDAVRQGCRHFLVGIGGSATNDGGIGMLQALGFGCLDREGKQVPFGAKGLAQLAVLSEENVWKERKDCTFRIACDVTNPLCGKQGCSVVFGPQKGADPQMVEQMDIWMERYAEIAERAYPAANPNFPGAGAAGGMGFAFLTFTNAVLESGVQMILEETGIEALLEKADLVITGEGRLDGQTAMGKAPVGVAQLAKKYGKPVIALAGSVSKEAAWCHACGIDAYFSILQEVTTLEEAMQRENARKNLADTAEQIFRLQRLFRQ